MTDQERQQGFYNAIRAAELTYGLTLQAEVKVEQLGEAVLMRPNLVIVPLPNWEPPQNGHTNGTPTNTGVNLIENPTQDKDTTHETSV